MPELNKLSVVISNNDVGFISPCILIKEKENVVLLLIK